MGAIRKRKIAKLETKYVQQQEIAGIAETRKRKRLFRRLAIFFVFASVISVLMVSTFISQISALEQKQSERKKLEQQMAGLEKKEQILKEEIIKLNDDEYIAKLARSEYFLSKKGEIIIKLPEGKKETTSQ
ncbi:FtsB family cell division protein [Bacillus sp. T33-2]|uniref:FtsB family cell division protein n=1 Tax=Bacillus sp. T33-2 TaxID=2054168 RepID=UPI000C765644|nr:septum formation initiator family protein [Bacillus sp. T33-2]PLR91897.1 cell division protein DIVIC [Bacillus sp. T33-2]